MNMSKLNLTIPKEEDNDDDGTNGIALNKRADRATTDRESGQRTYHETDSWLTIPAHIEQEFMGLGYRLGWLRIFLNGNEDYKAVGEKVNAGWEFVPSKDVPDMTIGYGYHKENDRFENMIVRGDVALAKIPVEVWNLRRQGNLDRDRDMNDAINARLNSMQDKRMPISNSSKSRVQVGGKPTAFDT
jgi:hypothetical protein